MMAKSVHVATSLCANVQSLAHRVLLARIALPAADAWADLTAKPRYIVTAFKRFLFFGRIRYN